MSEPVEQAGTPSSVGFGAWDSREIGRPCVVRIGSVLWLFYSGCDTWFEWKIGSAFSEDGIDWQRLDDDPIMVPPTRRIEGDGPHSYQDPCVVDLDGGLVLVASAAGGAPGAWLVAAASADLLEWTPPAEIVAIPPEAGESSVVRSPWLIRDGRTLHLFATHLRTAGDGTRRTAILRFVRAGEAWSNAGTAIPAPADAELDHPCVVALREGGYRLWCSVFRDGEWHIATATSQDLQTWSGLARAIEGDQASPFETSGVFGPSVLVDNHGFRMWHLTSSRTSDGMSVSVAARRSADGVTWDRVSPRPVFSPRPGIPIRPW